MMVHRRSRDSRMTRNETFDGEAHPSSAAESADWWPDRWNIALLILLYTVQGLPMGFVFGSVPFLLKENVGFNDLAVFALAGWPYSIKLLMAPIVDSVYSSSVGRRKSWIIPVQTMSGSLMLLLSGTISQWVTDGNVYSLTPTFFLIMFLTATQDIAVDAWALTMLRPENLAYASTCQSVGLSIGYFATFTILLALQDTSFSNTYVRPWWGGTGPMSSLAQMLQIVGLLYVVATVVILLKEESTRRGTQNRRNSSLSDSKDHELPSSIPVRADANGYCDVEVNRDSTRDQQTHASRSSSQLYQEVLRTYRELFKILKLPAIRALLLVLLTAKTGFSAYDNVSALKLLDLGFPKQTMAMMAVAQGPISLSGSVLAGRWAAKAGPVAPYMCGFVIRVLMSLTGPPLVSYFGSLNGVITPLAYALVFITSVLYSFASECLMFVAAGALFLSISEKDIGGSYLTMLNTASNLGGMWHKSITLFLVDRLTLRTVCTLPAGSPAATRCPIVVDGYQVLSLILMPVAVLVGVFVNGSLRRLMSLPASAWRTSREQL